MRLHADADTHDPDTAIKLPLLRRRSDITEMMVAGNLLLALTQTGVCVAFKIHTLQRVCYLNIAEDEIIRSLFYNKANRTVITVSVYRNDDYSSLKCRSTPISALEEGNPLSGIPVFQSESLRYPGFIEFDEVNSKILTYSASNCHYKVWDLINYSPLHSFCDSRIAEVKVSLGIMLLVIQHTKSNLPLKLIDIENGKELKTFNHLIKRNRKIDFVELFNEKLLIKQAGENLIIVDVCKGSFIEVSQTDFPTPSAFIFLYENQLFLTFRGNQVYAWNFKGQIVTKFEDHCLFTPDFHSNSIFISRSQDLIISHCTSENSTRGSINISSVFSGALLGKISCPDSDGHSARGAALDNITSLCFSEQTGTVYTGNRNGMIYAWSN